MNPQTVIKATRLGRSGLRKIGSALYNRECRLLHKVPCLDVNGTPKLFPRSFDRLLELTRDDDLIDLEFLMICRREGYPVEEIPIVAGRRHGGEFDHPALDRQGPLPGRVPDLERPARMSRPDPDTKPTDDRDALHQAQHHAWRDPALVASHWSGADEVDPRSFEHKLRGPWWDLLDEAKITLLITREHEHLVIAMQGGRTTFMALPHPSGLAVDRARNVVHVASTRNPNQVFDLMPVSGTRERLDRPGLETGRELVPVRSRFYPGCLYIHDLALIGGDLHANAVGENAIVRLHESGRAEPRLVAEVHRGRRVTPVRPESPPAQLDRGGAGPGGFVLLGLVGEGLTPEAGASQLPG